MLDVAIWLGGIVVLIVFIYSEVWDDSPKSSVRRANPQVPSRKTKVLRAKHNISKRNTHA